MLFNQEIYLKNLPNKFNESNFAIILAIVNILIEIYIILFKKHEKFVL